MRNALLTIGVALAFAGAASAQSEIQKIDFQNFTYTPSCAGDPDEGEPTRITVNDGAYSYEKQEDGYVDRMYFNVLEVAYGDLNGDRRQEAVVLTLCNTGGTGNFSEGFIYSLTAGKPKLIATIPGGDRAHGGLRTVRVEKGLLVVESNDAGELGGACCPEFVVTTKYRLSRDRIVRSGAEIRRPLYPTERIRFAPGTSGKTFKTTIPSGEGRRFIVGARANQNLIVSIDNENVQFRLLEDARVTEGVGNFLAKLPKSGDYTVELRNDLGKPVTVTVNIKIQ